MASAKALAAIALTLIVAIPIGLGYGLATHSVSYDEWQTSATTSLSDEILNSSTPYTNDSYSANNNNQLLQMWQFPGAGVTEYHTVTPDYAELSSNPSALTTYSTNNVNYPLSSATTTNHPAPGGGTVYRVGSAGYTDAPLNSAYNHNLDYLVISITTDNASPIHWEFFTDDGNEWINPLSQIKIIRDGADTWRITYNAAVGGEKTVNGVSEWCLSTDVDATISVTYRRYTEVESTNTYNIGRNYSFNTSPSADTAVKLTLAGGETQYLIVSGEKLVSVNGNNVVIGGDIYTGVTSINVAYIASVTTLSITALVPTGEYADPSKGWRIPTPEDTNVFSTWWLNSFSNASVSFMIRFAGDATLYMGPANGTTSLATYTVASAGGVISVNGTTLGEYSSIQAVISTDGATFVGISAWPSMGVVPVALNTVSVPGTIPMFNAVRLYMSPDDVSDVYFRVDLSRVLAGTFPSTKDYTLDMSGLFPGKSYAVKLNSIGVYGDRIVIGGPGAIGGMFFIENGRIDVNGNSVPLKGAVIRSIYNGTNYDNSINGFALPSTASPAEIYFGGEWSLTITAELLEYVENAGTREEWNPGEFAFDEDSFKGAIVLAAVVAFIGVGLYGARSGVKVGLLIMICGGAALVAMIML